MSLAAALPFQMGPTADKAACLIIKMRQFDLQTAFRRSRPGAEYLEDQAGPVDDLDVELLFQISLLDRAETAIDNQYRSFLLFHHLAYLVHLTRSEQGGRLGLANRKIMGRGRDQSDGQSEADGFIKAMLERGLAQRHHVGMYDERLAALAVETFLLKWYQCAPSSALL